MTLVDKIPAPSWVDGGPGQVRGYDLLGLRLPAQAISNALLDGVTTITPTVRYLTVCAWLAHRYAQAGRPGAWEPFRQFASGAEAAVAFGNLLNDPSRGGVLGAVRARELILSASPTLPLRPLVGQIGVQIYANPSSQLFLQDDAESAIPRLTVERGVPLAEALAGAVSGCELGRILNSGESPESAGREELAEFGRFVDVTNIPESEADLITDALLPERPLTREVPRVATYATLLSLAKTLGRAPTPEDLFRAAAGTDAPLPEVLRETLDGWLNYLVRDSLAVCHEAVMEAVVNGLESRGGADGQVDSAEVLGHLIAATDEHAAALRKIRLLMPGESPTALSFRDIAGRIRAMTQAQPGVNGGAFPRRWPGGIVELDLINAARDAGADSLALLPVAWLIALERADLASHARESRPGSPSRLGWARVGIQEVVAPAVEEFLAEDKSFQEVMAVLARRTVDQHLRIAWARWSQDPKRDVALLLADGRRWILRKRKFRAGRTDSRLGVSLSWLRQLRLIDEGGLTASGSTALDRALAALEDVGHE